MKKSADKASVSNAILYTHNLFLTRKRQIFALLNYDTSGKVSDVWRVIQMQTTAEYEILKGLKAKGMLGYYYAYK